DVKLAGTYHVEFRLADQRQAGGTCHLQIDGENVSGAIRVPKDADFSAWRKVSKNGGVTLGAGPHVGRVWFDAIGASGAIPGEFSYFGLVRADLAVAATPAPEPPERVRAKAISPSQIDLSWTDKSAGQAGFKIERARKEEVFATIATCPPGATHYSDGSLT